MLCCGVEVLSYGRGYARDAGSQVPLVKFLSDGVLLAKAAALVFGILGISEDVSILGCDGNRVPVLQVSLLVAAEEGLVDECTIAGHVHGHGYGAAVCGFTVDDTVAICNGKIGHDKV